MTKHFILLCAALMSVVTMRANTVDAELKLHNPMDGYDYSLKTNDRNFTYLDFHTLTADMSDESSERDYFAAANLSYNANVGKGYFGKLFSMESNPGVKPYKFWDDVSFAGIPIFVAGLIVKGEKTSFRQDYNNLNQKKGRLLTNFKTHIDDYTQLVPFGVTTVLNLAGYEGRSKTVRYAVSAGLSYAIMAGFVNSIKYTAQEMRPDGSTRNSFPSGHTATAFTSATILHKEYGLTRSPWWSVGGYTMATATGVMRVLNNRHWVSDIFAGAGIGILSAELAYGISDLIFKGKGLNRGYLKEDENIIYNPSYFSLSMGVGLGSKHISFVDALFENDVNAETLDFKFRSGTAVAAEGAYFINQYVGFGGRLRVLTTPVSGWDNLMARSKDVMDEVVNDFSDEMSFIGFSEDLLSKTYLNNVTYTIESDHLTEFAADLGVYFNFPLNKNFALGTKFLAGRSIMQALEVSSQGAGNQMVFNLEGNTNEEKFMGPYCDNSWTFLSLEGNNSMKYGTGLSLTYAYKNNFSWKLFVDYDFTRKEYTLEVDLAPYIENGMPDYYNDDTMITPEDKAEMKYSQSIKKNINRFVIGASFCVTL